jgi:DNA-binding response OmpR family regulator
MNRLLLVDDDPELCEMLGEYLNQEGFVVTAVHDGQSGVDQALSEAFDVMVLDVMLPEMNGIEVLRSLRLQSSLPVIMLTARGDDIDRIIGLEIGADDYLPKPCNPRELVARLRAVLRRTEHRIARPNPLVKEGEVQLNTASREVLLGTQPLELTSTEFRLLEILLRQAGQVVSKEDLSEQVLGRKLESYDRSIDMHISKLRRKLGDNPQQRPYVQTIRGSGYQFTGS